MFIYFPCSWGEPWGKWKAYIEISETWDEAGWSYDSGKNLLGSALTEAGVESCG